MVCGVRRDKGYLFNASECRTYCSLAWENCSSAQLKPLKSFETVMIQSFEYIGCRIRVSCFSQEQEGNWAASKENQTGWSQNAYTGEQTGKIRVPLSLYNRAHFRPALPCQTLKGHPLQAKLWQWVSRRACESAPSQLRQCLLRSHTQCNKHEIMTYPCPYWMTAQVHPKDHKSHKT